MSIDESIYLGPYVRCVGPMWLGNSSVIAQFQEEALQERLIEVTGSCSQPEEGAALYVPNVSWDGDGATAYLDAPRNEEPGFKALPTEATRAAFKRAFRADIDALKEMYREVTVATGLIWWAW